MSDPMGLSIGTTNLVAVIIGNHANQPVTRPSVLTLPGGATMTGFVERVGDPVPLVAPDGSVHAADRLLAARVVRPWPGAKEPGETVAAGRRRMVPPGVPDPDVWGER